MTNLFRLVKFVNFVPYVPSLVSSWLKSQLCRIFRMYSQSHVVQLGDLPWALVLEAASSTSPKPKGQQSQGQRVAPVALVTKPEEIVAR